MLTEGPAISFQSKQASQKKRSAAALLQGRMRDVVLCETRLQCDRADEIDLDVEGPFLLVVTPHEDLRLPLARQVYPFVTSGRSVIATRTG